ncbi:MAG: T9SS type A sorting domain-containing protein [Gelidibacter sp.]
MWLLGVDELLSTKVAIYPNPTDGQLSLSNNHSFDQMNVYSMDGKLVVQKTLQAGANEMHFNLNSGIYILELNGTIARATKKLVVK